MNCLTVSQLLLLISLVQIISGVDYKVTDQVYFDVKIGKKHEGRIVFGLFGEVAPKTVKNFKTIATKGIGGRSYAGTSFHRAVERFMIQGGDIVNNDGTGSISIYGEYFGDENFTIPHSASGLLSMVNAGPNTNGCQFFITTMPAPWLDGKNVVFGKVLQGNNIVHKIEHLKTDVDDKILEVVRITKCGAIKTIPFYESTDNYELSFWSWVKAGWIPVGLSFGVLGFFQYIIHKMNALETFQ